MSTIDANGAIHDGRGRFDGHLLSEGDTSLLDDNPLASQSPIEIDTQLAELYSKKLRVANRIEGTSASIHRAAGDRQVYYRRGIGWHMSFDEALEKARQVADTDQTYLGIQARKAIEEREQYQAEFDRLQAASDVLDAEYQRRGGWPRAFLVTNSNGHVHSSMSCSTCNRNGAETRFAWMTDYSGKSEDEIVDAAGWRACTACFPSAPVGDEHSLPTKMFTEDELAAAKAREERAAAKLKRDADRIAKSLTGDGSEFSVMTGAFDDRFKRQPKESFKTEQAATQWAVGHIVDRGWYYTDPHPALAADLAVRDEAVERVIAAVAAKHGRTVEDVRSDFQSKALAKARRDGWTK